MQIPMGIALSLSFGNLVGKENYRLFSVGISILFLECILDYEIDLGLEFEIRSARKVSFWRPNWVF